MGISWFLGEVCTRVSSVGHLWPINVLYDVYITYYIAVVEKVVIWWGWGITKIVLVESSGVCLIVTFLQKFTSLRILLMVCSYNILILTPSKCLILALIQSSTLGFSLISYPAFLISLTSLLIYVEYVPSKFQLLMY